MPRPRRPWKNPYPPPRSTVTKRQEGKRSPPQEAEFDSSSSPRPQYRAEGGQRVVPLRRQGEEEGGRRIAAPLGRYRLNRSGGVRLTPRMAAATVWLNESEEHAAPTRSGAAKHPSNGTLLRKPCITIIRIRQADWIDRVRITIPGLQVRIGLPVLKRPVEDKRRPKGGGNRGRGAAVANMDLETAS